MIIAIALIMIFMVGCSSGGSESDDIAGDDAKATLVAGAESLEGKKVYVLTPSSGFATGDNTVKQLEEETTEEEAPFLKVAHNGKEIIDKKSGVTFVCMDYTSSEKMVIYYIDDMSVDELQNLYTDEFKKNIGEFESTYGKCYVMKK